MFYKTIAYILILLFGSSAAFSNETIFNGNFVQGGIVIGQNKLAKKVYLNEKNVQISKGGYFIFGFGRNQKQNSTLKVIQKNNLEQTHNLKHL